MKPLMANAESDLFESLTGNTSGFNVLECQTCGKCISACSWYEVEGRPNPRQLVRMAALGLEDELAKSPMLWTCMACNRCVVDCPMEVDIGNLVRNARFLDAAKYQVPADFHRGIKLRLEFGNVNGVEKEDYIDTLEWLSEEMQTEKNDENAGIPLDKKGSKYVYLPNPREVDQIAMHLLAMCGLLEATGDPYTLCSDISDVTNWGYFLGDDETSRKMATQVVEAVENLQVETLVLSECGHGYLVAKQYYEKWLGRKPNFETISILELIERMMNKGVFKFDPKVHDQPIAYHDPCKVGRASGLFDAPRNVLAACCKEVVELWPNKMYSLCCGGGGGFLQDSKSKDKRMNAGKAKAEQIRQSGVQIVATSCLSCQRQLMELSKHYDLGVTISTVASLAAKALIVK